MDRIIVVTKPTGLEDLVQKHLTEGAVKFFIESQGKSMEIYQTEDLAYKEAIAEIRRQIPGDIPTVSLRRSDIPNFLFRDNDLVIACGPDGLFANLAQYVRRQPILTVNPDKNTVAGILMLFEPEDVGGVIGKVRSGKHKVETIPLVKATIDDDKVIYGVNDIFIGRKDHISVRYEISFNGRKERQSSSGVVISTGIGSTGWIKSIQAMVEGLTGRGNTNKLSNLPSPASEELVFVVREPFPSPKTGASIVIGRVVPGSPLVMNSEMSEGGYIFSDGVTEKATAWNAGSTVVVTIGDRHVNRIVP